MSWKTLGATEPTALVDARLQLHHAAQIVAAAGTTFLEPQPDDSHPNLGWVDSLGALVSRALPGANARVGLRLADLVLFIVNERDELSDELALDGQTLDDGHGWLATASADAGATLPATGITRASYALPHHPVADGAAFSIESDVTSIESGAAAFAELAHWFAAGHDTLTELTDRMPGASDVRCWPHHFDLGSLAVVATDADGGLAKSIGLGLSPGDEDFAEPYGYVSPWPYPEPATLPALGAGGRWHTQGHTSAILTGSELLAGPPSTQRDRMIAFLDDAVGGSRTVLV